MGRRRYGGVHVGLSTVVTMFVVIALTIFAALSVSTAAQEKKLAEKYAASVSAYWAADAECAQLANDFGALWSDAASDADMEKLAADSGASVTRRGENLLVSYSRPISEILSLEVTLRLGGTFEIEQWRMMSTDADWAPDNGLPVWQGQPEVDE